MSYADGRDFAPEYVTVIDGTVIEIEKLGGGTLGRAYSGTWRCQYTPPGDVPHFTQDLTTGTPKTHAQAAVLLAEFLGLDTEYATEIAPF